MAVEAAGFNEHARNTVTHRSGIPVDADIHLCNDESRELFVYLFETDELSREAKARIGTDERRGRSFARGVRVVITSGRVLYVATARGKVAFVRDGVLERRVETFNQALLDQLLRQIDAVPKPLPRGNPEYSSEQP